MEEKTPAATGSHNVASAAEIAEGASKILGMLAEGLECRDPKAVSVICAVRSPVRIRSELPEITNPPLGGFVISGTFERNENRRFEPCGTLSVPQVPRGSRLAKRPPKAARP